MYYSTIHTNEDITSRRLPTRNPYATKLTDGSYDYMGVRYFSRSALLRRGWTNQEIAMRLGDCDVRTTNPYNVSSNMMELFLARDVEDLEIAMGRLARTPQQAIEAGDTEAGIKIQINTLSYAGVYTSIGNGLWYPSTRNKSQEHITSNNLMFWLDNQFDLQVID